MQSNQTISTNQNESIAIDDLAAMLENSGWLQHISKPFYKTFSKGNRVLNLVKADNDFTLICKDAEPFSETLALPCLSKINPFPLMGILKAYGIISFVTVSTEKRDYIHGSVEMEATARCIS